MPSAPLTRGWPFPLVRCLMVGLGGLEPPTSSLSGFCPGACFRRIAPTTCANDLPPETAGDRCEPLGSDGVWTKRGPGTPLAGAAAPRVSGPCAGKVDPRGEPSSAGHPDSHPSWRPPAMGVLSGFCNRACFRRTALATRANEVPLKTSANCSVPRAYGPKVDQPSDAEPFGGVV
jgi:hypothetical protein